MGILDEAIREHLELKRAHGAGDSELKQLEDEAFGAAERPGDEAEVADPLAEAPTQFMSQPDSAEATEAVPEKEGGRRQPPAEIADLQEAPPAPEAEPEEPAEEPEPAMEHEAISPGPSTEERHAIAEQPTEMYDIEEELGGEAEAPSEEELLEEEISEPRLAPVDPLAVSDESEEKEVEVGQDNDDFFDEQRLSDELDQALEAPAKDEDEDELEVEASEEDFEADEEPVAEEPPSSARGEEDVLEETPDFLEEAPEDDQLWFEQKPPKDFDFDD